jgi:hypothetical protein
LIPKFLQDECNIIPPSTTRGLISPFQPENYENATTFDGFRFARERAEYRVRAIFVTSLLRLASLSVAKVREFDRFP